LRSDRDPDTAPVEGTPGVGGENVDIGIYMSGSALSENVGFSSEVEIEILRRGT
jgi:hypothetical protein